MRKPRTTTVLLLGLLAAHLLLGAGRLPGKVIGRRRRSDTARSDPGAARFLLERAKLGGADELEWLLEHTDEQCVVLWRWPCDGALEFAAALLAPRLVVDERCVPVDATTFAKRQIAVGTLPSGERGQIVLQGTVSQDSGPSGLLLTTRSN